jgi:hypothetical protein
MGNVLLKIRTIIDAALFRKRRLKHRGKPREVFSAAFTRLAREGLLDRPFYGRVRNATEIP